MRILRRLPLSILALGVATFATVPSVQAETRWVSRHQTTRDGEWAFNVGMGLGHADAPRLTGLGVNFEAAVGLSDRVDMGIRGGLRLGNDGRALAADQYGRLFDTETYGTVADTFANPEFRVRGTLLRGRVVELGLEGRAYLPIEQFSRIGIMPAIPLMVHLGRWGRLDTGMYVPIIFYDNVATAISLPAKLWFQVSDDVWLGPQFGVRFRSPGDRTDFPVGFGFGYQAASWFDFKAQVQFPHIQETAGARDFGLGAGVELRLE